MGNIHDLIARYVNNTITPEEAKELKRLIDSRQYEEIINEAFDDQVELIQKLQAAEDAHNTTSSEATHSIRFNDLRRRVQETEGTIRPLYPSYDDATEKPRSRWKWISAAAAVLIVLASVAIYQRGSWTSTVTNAKVFTATDLQVLTLPDGSRVILNRDSKLTYNSDFGKTIREVTLTGEASFDIAHDAGRKFIVHTGGVTTTVLGTAFNILQKGSDVIVTVTRGKVQVKDSFQHAEVLLPDQQLAANGSTQKFVKQTVDAKEALAWQENFLVFQKTPMLDVASRIEERFGVTVTLSPELQDCNLNAEFLHDESLTHILAVMSRLVSGEYKIKGEQVFLNGSCK